MGLSPFSSAFAGDGHLHVLGPWHTHAPALVRVVCCPMFFLLFRRSALGSLAMRTGTVAAPPGPTTSSPSELSSSTVFVVVVSRTLPFPGVALHLVALLLLPYLIQLHRRPTSRPYAGSVDGDLCRWCQSRLPSKTLLTWPSK